jgi:NitT/TauT family transport system substrate-binding protein
MPLRIIASRHSAFYSPLLCCIRRLRDEEKAIAYSVLEPGQRSYALLRDKETDIMQSAVSSNWNDRERGVEPLPVHFAQINTRDGFFLVGREPDPTFTWKQLEGRALLSDHGRQPLVMLKYALQHNGVDWKKIKMIDAGTPEQMEAAFRAGVGDYIHLQAPIVVGEVLASVGAVMPAVAFSSLCCAREFQKSDEYRGFLKAYADSREWVRSALPEEVTAALSSFFPHHAAEDIADAIRRYQTLGCWNGGIEIDRDLYEQCLNVFQAAGAISWRHRYEEVVG